ncbi:MAG TPA: thioredoxin family protein, partial [Bacteroidota bacterium]|nr:thioredoxin family protein [Bacteroidota bacterium]
MRRMFVLGIAVLALGFSAGRAQGEKPEPAKKIIDAALQQASISHKNVLVIFHASWCVWCRRLDSVLTNPEVSP